MLLLGTLALLPFRPLKVTGRSMEPTLRDGETYVLDSFYWRRGGVRRSDIVVVRHGEETWVKRLVGMPGDRLQITYRSTGLIADVANVTVQPERRRWGPFVADRLVEPGEIFVMGDNINRSTDSTSQQSGSFKLEDIVGVVRSFSLRREFPFRRRR